MHFFCLFSQISLVEIAADVGVRNQTLLDVHKVCSTQLVSIFIFTKEFHSPSSIESWVILRILRFVLQVQFWECLNATFDGELRVCFGHN